MNDAHWHDAKQRLEIEGEETTPEAILREKLRYRINHRTPGQMLVLRLSAEECEALMGMIAAERGESLPW